MPMLYFLTDFGDFQSFTDSFRQIYKPAFMIAWGLPENYYRRSYPTFIKTRKQQVKVLAGQWPHDCWPRWTSYSGLGTQTMRCLEACNH